jgi:hypothetical protein
MSLLAYTMVYHYIGLVPCRGVQSGGTGERIYGMYQQGQDKGAAFV